MAAIFIHNTDVKFNEPVTTTITKASGNYIEVASHPKIKMILGEKTAKQLNLKKGMTLSIAENPEGSTRPHIAIPVTSVTPTLAAKTSVHPKSSGPSSMTRTVDAWA